MTAVAVAAALALGAVALSRAAHLQLERELLVTAVRAAVQLTLVGLLVAVVFDHLGAAIAFVLVMFAAATLTSARRLREVEHGAACAGASIGVGVAVALVPLLASGAFAVEPEELIPLAGILIGGAMTATSVCATRVLEDVEDARERIETRLLLGATARTALAPIARRGVRTALVGVLDQTKSVGLVTLPGTFVGLLLGGASPGEAARLQLVVLLALLAVELVAALTCAQLVTADRIRPGERLAPPR